MSRKCTKVIFWVVLSLIFIRKNGSLDEDSGDVDDDDVGTLMEFEFADNAPYGPQSWTKNILPSEEKKPVSLRIQSISTLEKRMYEKNNCKSNWLSPINIVTEDVQAPELGKQSEASEGGPDFPETLIITTVENNIEKETWIFGHPVDNYNGIEVRSPNAGMMQLMDNFDPIGQTDAFVTYDFSHLTIYYCDLKKAPSHRSMHQIDGQRFPLEFHFVFLKNHEGNVQLYERGNTIPQTAAEKRDIQHQYIRDEDIALIVAVIGEVVDQKTGNKYFEPLVKAATNFVGKEFGDDTVDETNKVTISTPWSPTWLLPESSAYYYYEDGSFPVPPCWKVSRYYIMKERFNISQKQLDAFTNIQTAREKHNNNILKCTHSILQDEVLPGEVTLNLIEYALFVDDHRPRTPDEAKQWKAHLKKMDIFRKRMKGDEILQEKETNGATGKISSKMVLFMSGLSPFYVIIFGTEIIIYEK